MLGEVCILDLRRTDIIPPAFSEDSVFVCVCVLAQKRKGDSIGEKGH